MATDAQTVTPTAIRLAVEWLAANANGVSLIDWEPRSQTLLSAADEIERLGAELALSNEAVEGLRANLFECPAQEDRQRIKDWFRSLKRSLSYNGEWKPEDDEISKSILNGLGVES